MSNDQSQNLLAPYRAQIDAIDDQLIALLAQRFDIVRAVAGIKSQNDLSLVQSNRVNEVVHRNRISAAAVNVPADMVEDVFRRIIDEAHEVERHIIESNAA